MSRKHPLLATLASTAGLLLLAGLWSSAFASSPTDSFLICDNDGVSIPAHATVLVSCTTPAVPLSSFDAIEIKQVAPNASGTTGISILSIETTLNMLDSGNSQVDFIDFAFSPYANVTAGGANATFGAAEIPKLCLPKKAIQNDPIAVAFSITITQVQFQLQVYVTNNTSSAQSVSESLRTLVTTPKCD